MFLLLFSPKQYVIDNFCSLGRKLLYLFCFFTRKKKICNLCAVVIGEMERSNCKSGYCRSILIYAIFAVSCWSSKKKKEEKYHEFCKTQKAKGKSSKNKDNT